MDNMGLIGTEQHWQYLSQKKSSDKDNLSRQAKYLALADIRRHIWVERKLHGLAEGYNGLR